MIKKNKTYKKLPFEEGKVYRTKFQTGDMFLLKKILWSRGDSPKILGFHGIYEKFPHIGICPLGEGRLIPEIIEDGEIEVCSKCGEPIN